MARAILAASLVLLLSACSSAIPTCPAAPELSVTGYTTGAEPDDIVPIDSGPFPHTATFLYFGVSGSPWDNTNTQTVVKLSGTPKLSASDGTAISSGPLAAVITAEDDTLVFAGYSSSVSGLEPNVTYAVAFASLRSSTGCNYPSQSAGSFTTN